jgi:hypothetical protein
MIEITGGMIARSKHIGLSDPCVICGGKFGIEFNWTGTCLHTQAEVADVVKRIKAMPPKLREAKLKGHA